MKLTSEWAGELLAYAGAILEGHFVGTSGKHLSMYIAKDRGTRFTSVASELCLGLAERFAADEIDCVVSPAVGGVALSQWTAHHLSRLRQDRPEVLALYSEHKEQLVVEAEKKELVIPIPPGVLDSGTEGFEIIIRSGEKLVVVKPSFVLKRGFDVDVKGKRVLGIEDILTTGGSAERTARAIEAAGGILVGFGVLANGGGITAGDLDVPRLEALITVKRQIFTAEECADHGLCKAGVPVNTSFGHGAAFLTELARQQQPGEVNWQAGGQ